MPFSRLRGLILGVCLTARLVPAQHVRLVPAQSVVMPVLVDSNSPAYWYDSQFHLVNSSGTSLVTSGANQFYLNDDEWTETFPAEIDSWEHQPMWIEAAYLDPDDGLLWAWYHNNLLEHLDKRNDTIVCAQKTPQDLDH